jgi:hypothetical protein
MVAPERPAQSPSPRIRACYAAILGLLPQVRKRAPDLRKIELEPKAKSVTHVGETPKKRQREATAMRVVITGAAGFVGQKLVAALAKAGTLGGERIDELALFDVVEPKKPAAAAKITTRVANRQPIGAMCRSSPAPAEN